MTEIQRADKTMNKTLFKFTILTPLAFLPPDHLEAYDCPVTEQFAKAVADRVWEDLHRPIFTPSTAGEAFINSDFDIFENRFLKNSEYAILVVPGQQAVCLDLVYGRLLVFLTLRSTWRTRFILIYIGDPVGQKLFEPSIFQTEPLVFSASPDVWDTETEKWDKLLGILRTEAVIPPEGEQKPSKKRPADKSPDTEAVPIVPTNESVTEAPNQPLQTTDQSAEEGAQPLASDKSADAHIALEGDNSSHALFPDGRRSFDAARTDFQTSDRVPSPVQQEEQRQLQQPLQQVRSSTLYTLSLAIDSEKQVSENEKTPTQPFKARSIRANCSSSQEFVGNIPISAFPPCNRRIAYDDSMCFIRCGKRRGDPQNDSYSISKAKGFEGEGQPHTDNVQRLFTRPSVRSAENLSTPTSSDTPKKKRQRTISDLFKSLRRKQKPKKREAEEKLGSTIGALATFSAEMLHTGADPAKEPVESKALGVKPADMQVQLTETCHQTETRAGMLINQTLFVVTSPAAESCSKTSQVSSTYVRRKARTDSGILSNYSLSSSEVNELCVSPALSSRSVNSSSFSSPKFDTSTGKSSLIYPTQGSKNAVPEPDARHEMFKLYPHLLSTKELESIYPLQTSSSPDGNVADFPQTTVSQAQSPFSGMTGLQETHFPDAAGEFNYADADWDQPYFVRSDHHEVFAPPSFREVAKNGVLPGVTKKSSNVTSSGERFMQPVIITPVRAQQQLQTAPAVAAAAAAAAAISPIKNDRVLDAPTDSNQQIKSHQDVERAFCFQGLESSPDCQVSRQKYPGVSEQKMPCIMNLNSCTSWTPDSEDEQTVYEISDRELFLEPSSFQGNNKIDQPDDEDLNSVNSMGDTGIAGVLMKKVEPSPTFAQPPTNLEDNGLPSFTKDAVILSTRQGYQNLVKSGLTTDQTDAQILESTINGVAESSEIPLQSSDGRNHEWVKPGNCSLRVVPAEITSCSPVTAHLESAICLEFTSNLATQQPVPDKSTILSADSDAQSVEESASTASSDPPTQISRATSECDLQTANFYLREHQHPPSEFASNGVIANATFPRMKAGRFAAIPRPSPSILRLVETAYESYERFPSLGLPYSEEQSRIDEKRCVLMYDPDDSGDFKENSPRQAGEELLRPSRCSLFSSRIPHILVDVINLSTAYIPRYLSCVYDWPRTAMHNPDKSLETILRSTQTFLFNNPLGIAGVFLCTTLAAPHLQQIPFLLASTLSPQTLVEAAVAVARQPGAFFSERFCDLVAVFRTTPNWSALAISGSPGLHWHFARPAI